MLENMHPDSKIKFDQEEETIFGLPVWTICFTPWDNLERGQLKKNIFFLFLQEINLVTSISLVGLI